MAIANKITGELTALQAQVAAASPLSQAGRATVTAIKLNAAQLVTDVQGALTVSSLLDTWAAPTDPAQIIAGVLSVGAAATDSGNLALMRGVVGRAISNLDQIPS